MDNAGQGKSFTFGLTGTTILWGTVAVVAIFALWPIIAGLRKLLGWTSSKVGDFADTTSQALDATAEQAGYNSAMGEVGDKPRYDAARIAYAKAQGYKPGTPEWSAPPGFPVMSVWLDEHPAYKASLLDTFFQQF